MKLFLKNNIVLFLFFVSSLLVIIISITANISARRSVEMMEQSIKSHLTSAAAAASHLLSAEELDVYRTKADTENPSYERLRQRLMSFAKEHQVLYVYYWRDNGDNRIQYIIDNDTEDSLGPDNFFEMEDLALLALSGQPFTTDLGEYSPTMDGLLSALAPVFDSKGRVSCVAGVDISDELIIKQRKVTLNRYIIQTAAVIFSIMSGWAMMVLYRKKALQSQSANAAKGLFLSTVSHEIRTPMNAIIGISELALREETSPAVSGYLKNIQHAGS
ncbi:MAG: sensor histidine kinase, partial [Spirochaetia bacterium]|nr:sensor histidine kinase [Spirochaetia bacterium]